MQVDESLAVLEYVAGVQAGLIRLGKMREISREDN